MGWSFKLLSCWQVRWGRDVLCWQVRFGCCVGAWVRVAVGDVSGRANLIVGMVQACHCRVKAKASMPVDPAKDGLLSTHAGCEGKQRKQTRPAERLGAQGRNKSGVLGAGFAGSESWAWHACFVGFDLASRPGYWARLEVGLCRLLLAYSNGPRQWAPKGQ